MTTEDVDATRVVIAWWKRDGQQFAAAGCDLNACAMQFLSAHPRCPLDMATVVRLLEPLSGRPVENPFV